MKNVLYIGNNDTSKIFDDTAKEADVELFSRFAENMDAKKILALLKGANYHSVIINSSEIPKAIDELGNIIETIIEEYGETKLCLMCPGAKTNSPEIKIALNTGVQYIMPYEKDKGKIHVFKLLIDDNNTGNLEEVFKGKKGGQIAEPKKKIETNSTQQISQVEKKTNKNSIDIEQKSKLTTVSSSDDSDNHPITIAIGGSIGRIGTTLVAIQILKSLSEDGARVCYVNSTFNDKYLECLRTLYIDNIKRDDFNRRFILGDIDFYYKVMRDSIEFILSQNYDYILYDFGNIYNDARKINIFLKMDKKILCCGAKCNEYGNALAMLSQFENEDVKFIFNLVPNSYISMIKKTFTENKHKECYFMPYIESEFFVSSRVFLTIGKIFKFKNKQEILNKIKILEKNQKENIENE